MNKNNKLELIMLKINKKELIKYIKNDEDRSFFCFFNKYIIKVRIICWF